MNIEVEIWKRIVAGIMYKHGLSVVAITNTDLDAMRQDERFKNAPPAVVLQDIPEGYEVSLMDAAEAGRFCAFINANGSSKATQ